MGVDKLLEVFYHNLWLFEFSKNFLRAKNRIYRKINFLYIVPVQEFFSKLFNEILIQFFSRLNFLGIQRFLEPSLKINLRSASTIFRFRQKSQVLLR